MESDLQLLCLGVLEIDLDENNCCPFCYSGDKISENMLTSILAIKHNKSCPYLIATDLVDLT